MNNIFRRNKKIKGVIILNHIFMGTVSVQEYYLGYVDRTYLEASKESSDKNPWRVMRLAEDKQTLNLKMGLWGNRHIKIDETLHSVIGEVIHRIKFKEHEWIDESEDLLRELEVGESAYFNEKEYKVEKKSYGLNGEVIYFTNSHRIENDEKSLEVAKDDLEKRKAFLEKNFFENAALVHEEIENGNWISRAFKSK